MPECNHKWCTTDSRARSYGRYRRKKCKRCGDAKSTMEIDIPVARKPESLYDALKRKILSEHFEKELNAVK